MSSSNSSTSTTLLFPDISKPKIQFSIENRTRNCINRSQSSLGHSSTLKTEKVQKAWANLEKMKKIFQKKTSSINLNQTVISDESTQDESDFSNSPSSPNDSSLLSNTQYFPIRKIEVTRKNTYAGHENASHTRSKSVISGTKAREIQSALDQLILKSNKEEEQRMIHFHSKNSNFKRSPTLLTVASKHTKLHKEKLLGKAIPSEKKGYSFKGIWMDSVKMREELHSIQMMGSLLKSKILKVKKEPVKPFDILLKKKSFLN